MNCKAIKKAYYNKHLVEIGETVNYKEGLPLPTWLVEVKPIVATEPVTDDCVAEDNLEQLRAEAKELGYKFYRNAGKSKLQEYISKHSK